MDGFFLLGAKKKKIELRRWWKKMWWRCGGQCSPDVRSYLTRVNDIPSRRCVLVALVTVYIRCRADKFGELHLMQNFCLFSITENETWEISSRLSCELPKTRRRLAFGLKVTYGLLAWVHAIEVRPRRKRLRSRFSRAHNFVEKRNKKKRINNRHR